MKKNFFNKDTSQDEAASVVSQQEIANALYGLRVLQQANLNPQLTKQVKDLMDSLGELKVDENRKRPSK